MERLMQYMVLPPQPDILLPAPASPPPPRNTLRQPSQGDALKEPLLQGAVLGGSQSSGNGSSGWAGVDPGPGWVQQGHVVFDNVCLRYSPCGPDVLQALSLDILPGTKLGICGRTGEESCSILGRACDA
jgi:ABC-type multidrug transport system fused ATPase/permease subunit